MCWRTTGIDIWCLVSGKASEVLSLWQVEILCVLAGHVSHRKDCDGTRPGIAPTCSSGFSELRCTLRGAGAPSAPGQVSAGTIPI